jgi:hypothetical protein
MATAVVISLSAQVVDAERSPIGWIAAAIPALGFLAMVKIALAQPDTSTTSTPPAAASHNDHPDPAPDDDTGTRTPASVDPVTQALVPAARAAATELDRHDRRLSRHALAEALRADGHAISNARTSELLTILKAERGNAPPLRVLDHQPHQAGRPTASG